MRGLTDQAARDNAEWCEAVARSHGIRSRFRPEAWLAASRTPPRFPDAVTLRSTADRSILDDIDDSAGCSIKDSYGVLDLEADGYRMLFEARWIARSPGGGEERGISPERERTGHSAFGARAGHGRDAGILWDAVSASGFDAWARLQDGTGVFRRSLLTEAGIVLLAGMRDGELVGGAVLSHTGGVVGISNVTAIPSVPLDAVWRGIGGNAQVRFPGLSLVGYESGADLLAPLEAGFSEFGDLRVWVR